MNDPKQCQDLLARKMNQWNGEEYVDDERHLKDDFERWVATTQQIRKFLAEKSNCP